MSVTKRAVACSVKGARAAGKSSQAHSGTAGCSIERTGQNACRLQVRCDWPIARSTPLDVAAAAAVAEIKLVKVRSA